MYVAMLSNLNWCEILYNNSIILELKCVSMIWTDSTKKPLW